MTNHDPLSESKPEPSTQIPLMWRIMAIGVAVIIITVLLWPRISRRPVDAPENTAKTVETMNNSSPDALFEQGQAHYRAGEWDAAIAAYQKVVDLDPNFQSAYVNLGDAYYQNNQLDLAVEAYQRAVELAPDDAEVAYNLGATYLQQALAGNEVDQAVVERAIDQIELAIELDPKLPHPHYGLGAAYQILGNYELAIQHFEQFLELDDGSDAIATSTAQQTLQQLKAAQGQ